MTHDELLREAGRTACSLLTEGYRLDYKTYFQADRFLYMRFRHCRNRNTILLTLVDNKYQLYKNGKPIKTL